MFLTGQLANKIVWTTGKQCLDNCLDNWQTKLLESQVAKALILSKQSGQTTNRAARTLGDFTDGREGALSVTSPMDATFGDNKWGRSHSR